MEISDICARLNERASTLAPDLLPNGRRAGNKWMFSGIDDHGQSESAYVILSGVKVGKWFDHGNAAPGEDKGDMLDLIRLKRCNGDQRAAIAEAKRELGVADGWAPGAQLSPAEKAQRAEAARQRREKKEREDADAAAKRIKGARVIFLRSAPIRGTPAERYLQGRGLAPVPGRDWPGSYRFNPECWCSAVKDKVPALVCGVYDRTGSQTGVHRIYLEQRGGDWVKLSAGNAKMAYGATYGNFIPVHQGRTGKSMRHMPEGEQVFVTEGPEDAIAVAMCKPDARVICGIYVVNFGAILLPEHATNLVIVADRDENGKAQDQLERAIAQQQSRGLNVSLVMPPVGIKDINDWLLADQTEKGAA